MLIWEKGKREKETAVEKTYQQIYPVYEHR